jgi:hypothetical protein
MRVRSSFTCTNMAIQRVVELRESPSLRAEPLQIMRLKLIVLCRPFINKDAECELVARVGSNRLMRAPAHHSAALRRDSDAVVLRADAFRAGARRGFVLVLVVPMLGT